MGDSAVEIARFKIHAISGSMCFPNSRVIAARLNVTFRINDLDFRNY